MGECQSAAVGVLRAGAGADIPPLRRSQVRSGRGGVGAAGEGRAGRRRIGKTDYHAQGVLYLPESARFSSLQKLPEGEDLGKAVNAAMRAIEAENEERKDILPKAYQKPGDVLCDCR